MRHVYPTNEIAHLWAHQTQSDARNPQGNLFFQGPAIYSYRTSWPLARIYTHKKRGQVVLTNARKYRSTTAGHQYAVNSAASHLACVAVPFVECEYYASREATKDEHAANLAYFAAQIKTHIDKAKRAMQVSTVEWRTREAVARAQDAITYSVFFGIRRKAPTYDGAALSAALDRARRIETPDPVRDAAKTRARERKAIRERAALQATYDQYCIQVAAYNAVVLAARAALPAARDPVQIWRDTGRWPSDLIVLPDTAPEYPRIDDEGYRATRALRRRMQVVFDLPEIESLQTSPTECATGGLLRVSGDQIETSQGARIPLDHAPRIWALVQACRNSQRAYTANGHTEHAGPYAIDSVSAEGELKAGCHTIAYAEIEALAIKLGLAPLGVAHG